MRKFPTLIENISIIIPQKRPPKAPNIEAKEPINEKKESSFIQL